MAPGLIIFFIVMTVLGGIFFRLTMWTMNTKVTDEEAKEGLAWMTIIFFIGFVVCFVIMANVSYNLAFLETSAMPLWLQQYWS